MRSYYSREIVPPDTEKRNYILRKLAYLKTNVKSGKKSQELIRSLRRQLKATEGKTLYYRLNKGHKIYIGDSETSKKQFLLAKDPWWLQTFMQEKRAIRNKGAEPVHKRRFIEAAGTHVSYQTVGGVMYKAGWFKDHLKPVQTGKAYSAKTPKDKDPYVGIELEFASSLTYEQVAERIAEFKLHEQVRVMYDGSIRINEIYRNKIEFCILTKFSDLRDTLERLKPLIFNRPDHFSPNDSCGLHVHLDVRHDDPKRVYRNLTSMQTVLFSLAADYRRENDYCVPVTTTDFDEIDHESNDAHYHAISKFSYFKHKTIEVRIHQSTLDLTRIEKWVTLLKTIADYKGDGMQLGNFNSEFNILKDKVKLQPELVKYIEERDCEA